ncbi:MAG: family 10 glycosylhydrolase [Clostridia bacterium]|nr:family 10 glycosylhydrolase [Clostridia bacterium]
MSRRFVALLLLFLTLLLFASCDKRGEDAIVTFEEGDSLPSHLVLEEEVPDPMVSVDVLMDKAAHPPVNYDNFKAVWLSQYDLMDVFLKGETQRSAADFSTYVTNIFQNIAESGFNTVILQVRPNGDSFYPSGIYPTSRYVTGDYGKSLTYDPLEILVDKAHQAGLSIHAWINPLRLMSEGNLQKVDSGYPIRRWYDDPTANGTRIVQVNSLLDLNPAYPEVRELILAGAREILETYHVDGLHLDDYFYPTTDPGFDAAAYAADGRGLSLAEFRRDCLNKLIADLYTLTKAVDPALLFTISPAGNLTNVYESDYADVYTWCGEPGYVDAIIPQVYFGLEHETHPFEATLLEWLAIPRCDSVRLFCGMTLEKAKTGTDPYAGSGENEWSQSKDILSRCLALVRENPHCSGVAFFSYQYLFHPLTGEPVEATKIELSTLLPGLQTIKFGDQQPVGQ